MTWTSVEMYEHGLDFFSEVVEGAATRSLDGPSPCEGWAAADVLGHVGEATSMGAQILRGGEISFEPHDPPSSAIEGDPTSWWNALATQARSALADVTDLDREIDSPMGRRSIREGLSFPAVDLFVHGWDLAAATGQTVTFPKEAIEFVRELFEKIPDEVARRPGVFSPPRDAAPDADATDQLVAWTGRDPSWSAGD